MQIDTRKWIAANLVEDFSGVDKNKGTGDVNVTVMADGNGLQGKEEGAQIKK